MPNRLADIFSISGQKRKTRAVHGGRQKNGRESRSSDSEFEALCEIKPAERGLMVDGEEQLKQGYSLEVIEVAIICDACFHEIEEGGRASEDASSDQGAFLHELWWQKDRHGSCFLVYQTVHLPALFAKPYPDNSRYTIDQNSPVRIATYPTLHTLNTRPSDGTARRVRRGVFWSCMRAD